MRSPSLYNIREVMLFSKKKKEKKRIIEIIYKQIYYLIHKILCRDFALSVSLCSFIYFILI